MIKKPYYIAMIDLAFELILIRQYFLRSSLMDHLPELIHN